MARDVCDALERIDLPEIDLQLHGLGTFSDAKRNGPAQRGAAAVLWAGVRQNEGLNRLRTKIENAVQRIGLEADRRKWHPHITLARLRGLKEGRILVHHALRNAALPTLSLIGVQTTFLFGGTLLIEVIFAYPGLGNLMTNAVRYHDLPVIQAVAVTYCVVVLVINAVVDVLYLVLNPRLRPA